MRVERGRATARTRPAQKYKANRFFVLQSRPPAALLPSPRSRSAKRLKRESQPARPTPPPSLVRVRARSYCHSDALGLCSGSSHESRARRPVPPNEPPRLSEGRPPLGLNRPADGVQDLHDLLLGVHVPVPVLFAVTELLGVLDEHLEPPRRRGGAIPLDLDVLRWRWRWRMASASLTATQHKQRGDPFLWGFWRETRRSMKASTGPGKGVRTQGARAGPKGRLPSLASAFLPSSRARRPPAEERRGSTGE